VPEHARYLPPPPPSKSSEGRSRQRNVESTNDRLEIPSKKIPFPRVLAFSVTLCLSLGETFVPLVVNPSSVAPVHHLLAGVSVGAGYLRFYHVSHPARARARGARRNRTVTSIASARFSRGNMTSLAASCSTLTLGRELHRSFNHITRLRRANVSPSFCLDLIE